MKQAAPVQTATQAPEAGTIVQRQCTCESCASKEHDGLQTKLILGSAHDPLEAEADRAAAQAMSGTHTAHDMGAPTPPVIRRKHDTAAAGGGSVPESVSRAVSQSGEPMAAPDRSFFERRFAHDFSKVRIHRGPAAQSSAREISAQAYTVGSHIAFGSGYYRPGTSAGRSLMAHELAHVVQQGGAGHAPKLVQRAVVQQGNLSITIDYSPIALVAQADYPTRIAALANTLMGAAPSASQITAINGLNAGQQKWLMFAIRLLNINIAAAGSLNKGDAFQRLLTQSSVSSTSPLPDPDRDFVFEVLRVSGWSEVAQTDRLTAPNAASEARVDAVVNPVPTSGSVTDPLNIPELRRRLIPGLRHLLTALDPAGRSNVGTRSLSQFQAIGDVVMEEAQSFFAPYADIARGNIYFLNPQWHPSAHISATTSITPDQDLRLGYLRNRAEIVGRRSSTNSLFIDSDIFADTNFDGSRARDQRALERIIRQQERVASIRATVNRLIHDTGRKRGSGQSTEIFLVTDFNADARTACEDHWRGIDTVCHEVMHALVHPDFQAHSANVRFPQVIREGFTEVLGTQLFNNRIIPKAAADPAFKAQLENGVSGAPCPAPTAGTIGYGSAGSGAEAIRTEVGNDNFRAAYFLGRPDLAGIS